MKKTNERKERQIENQQLRQQIRRDREQERYRAQLERYAKLMRAFDGREIMLGLYFPLLKGWREWSVSAIGPEA